MRQAVILLFLSAAALWAQPGEPVKPEPRPVVVEKYDFPQVTRLGEEFTLVARLKNQYPRLVLVSARLHVKGDFQALVPADEQTVFLEKGTHREVSWRMKRVGDGKASFFVEVYLLADGRGNHAVVPPAEKAALEKTWRGTFTDPTSEYEASLVLQVPEGGGVEGHILWTLKKSQRADYQAKIGLKGTEYVWGGYDASKRLLTIVGYRRDDPHGILGLDKYLLSLDQQGKKLDGRTWNHGKLDGVFKLAQED